jgi:uncharacterized membrane protein
MNYIANSTNTTNVSDTERLVSLAAGALLLYKALNKKSIAKAVAAGYLMYRGTTGYCPVYAKLNANASSKPRNVNIKVAVVVNKSKEEVYAFWRNLNNLPLFMKHIQKIDIINDITSEWTVKAPGGGTLKWKSDIVHDEPNIRIGWKSQPDALIENFGNVHFHDAGSYGTLVHLAISYHAPAGKLGEGVAHLLNPLFEKIIKEEIQNFKQYIETGKIPTTIECAD